MPHNKLQRKPSSETLASLALDSTLDSRMSSAEIPQMELLKVNYVQQCKEVRMPRPTAVASQLKRHSLMAVGAKYPVCKEAVDTSHSQFGGGKANVKNQSKVNIGAAKALQRAAPLKSNMSQRAKQPLPPPTIESWKFLQHQLPQVKTQHPQQQKVTCTPIPPKLRMQQAPTHAITSNKAVRSDDDQDYVDEQSCCNSSCESVTQYSVSSDEDVDDGASTVYPDCEKSHSWNYRARISTCDIRRDIARAGVKSRADRIARIEQTDCNHQQQQSVVVRAVAVDKRAPAPTASQQSTAKQIPAAVTQINLLFEQAKRPEQRRSTKQHRAPAPPQSSNALPAQTTTTAQPLRAAPTPIKELNMRMQTREMLPSIEERVKRFSNSSAPGDCYDCVLESNASASEDQKVRATADVLRPPRASPEQRQQVSRIPKPISESQQQQPQQRHSTSSAQLYNEANEQLQRRLRQMFDHEQEHTHQLQRQVTDEFRRQCAGEKVKLRATKSTAFETADQPERNNIGKSDSCDELDMHLSKQTRQHVSTNFQKLKMERVHIRKKRQPLLIINQLNESKSDNNDKAIEERAPEIKETKCNAIHKPTKEAAPKTPHEASRRTCGYKNCTFTNCPMSATSNADGSSSMSTPQQSDEELNTRKRLSLESCCSDSGVSSSTDMKEHKTKENNMKNIEKCADCVKILLHQTGADPTVMQHKLKLSTTAPLVPKSKELDGELQKEGQIKIRVGKAPGGDPNDLQNFAKKNLTKATTDELLTAALAKNNISNKVGAADKLSNRTVAASASNAANHTKQCNIENDLKISEQRIYNNTNCCNNNNNNNNSCTGNKMNGSERKPLCATTIKIDDNWLLDQQNAFEANSLLVPPSPPLRVSSKAASGCQHYINNNNKHSHSAVGDNDKHSVKIFVRSSTSSGGVGVNPARASSVSMCSYTSQTSGCSTNSEASALTSGSKASTSGSSYTTISSSASSSEGKCNCRRVNRNANAVATEAVDESAIECEDTEYYCSLEHMNKAGVFYNHISGAAKSNPPTQSDTLRACASSPPPSMVNFSEVSCVACGDEREQQAKSRQSGGSSGPIDGIFWNNSYFQQDADLTLESVSKAAHKKNAVGGGAPATAEHSEQCSDDNEHCCCSLTSCDDDNCSYYECGGDAQTDDDHCVSRIEVHASVHTPSGGSESNNDGYKAAVGNKSKISIGANDVCNCDARHCCVENTGTKDKFALEVERQRVRERERCAVRQQQQQEQQWLRQRIRERERHTHFIRNSSAEEILIRNKKLLRKVSAWCEHSC